jgi:prepilin-type N-terminal cleavage/methylation domain-containing protein
MKNNLSKLKKKKKGFTLIELIVVIAILGILAAVAVPKLTGLTANARTKADQSTLTTVNNAIQVYCTNNDTDDIVGVTGGSKTIADGSSAADVLTVLKANNLISSTATFQTTTYQSKTYSKAQNEVQ